MSKFKVGDKVKLSEIGIKNLTHSNGELSTFLKAIVDSVGTIDQVNEIGKWSVTALFEEYKYGSISFIDEELEFVEDETLSFTGGHDAKPDEEIGKPFMKVSYTFDANEMKTPHTKTLEGQVTGLPSFLVDDGGLTMTGNVVFHDKPSKQAGKFEVRAKELGAMVDEKQQAYGNATEQTFKAMKVFLEPYRVNGGYKISEDLLAHILLQVRIMDKQSRIFSNPTADLMGESPYSDIAGYGLLGSDLQEKNKVE
jgi:hypothetical protein